MSDPARVEIRLREIPWRLANGREMAQALGISVAQLNELRREGRIPSLRLGHRSFRYEPDRVKAAIDKREPPDAPR